MVRPDVRGARGGGGRRQSDARTRPASASRTYGAPIAARIVHASGGGDRSARQLRGSGKVWSDRRAPSSAPARPTHLARCRAAGKQPPSGPRSSSDDGARHPGPRGRGDQLTSHITPTPSPGGRSLAKLDDGIAISGCASIVCVTSAPLRLRPSRLATLHSALRATPAPRGAAVARTHAPAVLILFESRAHVHMQRDGSPSSGRHRRFADRTGAAACAPRRRQQVALSANAVAPCACGRACAGRAGRRCAGRAEQTR